MTRRAASRGRVLNVARRAATRRLGLVAVVAVLAGACVGEAPTSAVPSPPADALEWVDAETDLTGLSIAVGAKQPAIEQVLGHIAAEALQAAGAAVIIEPELGGAAENRDAQIAGLIDLYWESIGTAFVELRRETGASDDPVDLYESLRDRDLTENALTWLPPAPADPAPVVIQGPEVAAPLDVDAVSGLGDLFRERPEGFVLCVGGEGGLPGATSGVAALSRALEVRPRQAQVAAVTPDDLVVLVEGSVLCPHGLISRTAHQLAGADVVLLEDDVGAFVPENPAVVTRSELVADWPDIEAVFAAISPRLDDEALRRLGNDLTQDGATPRSVARSWLLGEGLARP